MDKKDKDFCLACMKVVVDLCSEEAKTNIAVSLSKLEFPINFNFVLKIMKPGYEKKVELLRNRYITFKFSKDENGDIYIDFNKIHFKRILKDKDFLKLEQLNVYKPKLLNVKDIYSSEHGYGDIDVDD